MLTAVFFYALLGPALAASEELIDANSASIAKREQALEREYDKELEEPATPKEEEEEERQNPINRVVILLQKMRDELEAEARNDEKIYEDMKCWCEKGAEKKRKEMNYDKSCIRKYTDEIEERAHNHGLYVAWIKQWEIEMKKAQNELIRLLALREKEHKEYNSAAQDLTQTIINGKNAVTVLRKHNGYRSFMQEGSPLLSEMRSVLRDLAFKHEELDDSRPGDHEGGERPSKAVLLQQGSNRAGVESAALEGNALYQKQSRALLEAIDIRGPSIPDVLPVKFAQEALAKAANQPSAGFLQVQGNDQAPAYQSYASQSNVIFGILEQMLEDFIKDKADLDAEEKKAREDYEALAAAKRAFLVATEAKLDETQVTKARNMKLLADAKATLKLCYNEEGIDTDFYRNLADTCQKVDFEWKERNKARSKEITAVAETLAILTEDEARETLAKGASFLQVEAVHGIKSKSVFHADDLLAAWDRHLKPKHPSMSVNKASTSSDGGSLSAFLGSGPLDLDAIERWTPHRRIKPIEKTPPKLSMVSTGGKLNPFTKIKVVMDRMVTNLKIQQEDEVKFKNECVADFQKNDKAMYEKTEEKEDLETEILALENEIKEAEKEMKEAKELIAASTLQMQKASQNREKENYAFQQTTADQYAIRAILTKALKRLKNYYHQAKGGDGKALVQEDPIPIEMEKIPEIEDQKGFGKYVKNKGASPVVGLIEQIIEDTYKINRDAKTSEAEAQKDYETMTAEATKEKKAQTERFETNKALKAHNDWEISNTQAKLDSVINEIEALEKYKGDLHKECDFVLKNFNNRQKARHSEIEGILGAKQNLMGGKIVLEGPDDLYTTEQPKD